MKKLFAGCLVVAALLGAGLAVAGYFAWRAARPALEGARAYLDSLSSFTELPELEARVARTDPYEPPATGELSPQQVERFARVQAKVRSTLGARVDEIEAKYQHLKLNRREGEIPPLRDAISALGELGRVILDGRRAQVDALNAEGFSRAEYEWVRLRVFQAAGYELAGGLDLASLSSRVRDGLDGAGFEAPDVRLPNVTLPDVPEQNRRLVRPLASEVGTWLPMAFFGL
ncbi:MAG: hypothetical protein AB7O67_07750 [Vicinamibacterales bacterium]